VSQFENGRRLLLESIHVKVVVSVQFTLQSCPASSSPSELALSRLFDREIHGRDSFSLGRLRSQSPDEVAWNIVWIPEGDDESASWTI
jgi:hypothetical protein